ncbi:MAG: DUF3806 domain-containing protein [Coriobacteriia bacterium]|nr:DUF3806 domain-containing protein [Coriobacteriia bacterium]
MGFLSKRFGRNRNSELRQFGSLAGEDEATLALDREFLPAVVAVHFPGSRLTGTAADLPLMQEILAHGPYTADAVGEAVALGTVLGDILCHSLDMSWVRYVDNDGVDLALRYQKTSLTVFPRSMILKRIEQGEDPDLADLHDGVCVEVRKMLASGEYR